jgi:hypothetical protein
MIASFLVPCVRKDGIIPVRSNVLGHLEVE